MEGLKICYVRLGSNVSSEVPGNVHNVQIVHIALSLHKRQPVNYSSSSIPMSKLEDSLAVYIQSYPVK